ncbi:hypothetical protein C8Q73DRAFT_186294 [Cubamyces lactineus]|nr:hypothetical protein C8Q73DRAFT_186294 [Cubamyces lactineus]
MYRRMHVWMVWTSQAGVSRYPDASLREVSGSRPAAGCAGCSIGTHTGTRSFVSAVVRCGRSGRRRMDVSTAQIDRLELSFEPVARRLDTRIRACHIDTSAYQQGQGVHEGPSRLRAVQIFTRHRGLALDARC